MRRGTLVAAGILALGIGLILYLPATVVSGWAESTVPGLRFSGVSGTALEGRAAQVLYDDVPPLQGVAWQARPWALLIGRGAVDVRLETDVGRLTGTVFDPLFGTGLRVTDVAGNASLAWLARRAGYNFMPVSGRIRLDVARARVDANGSLEDIAGTAIAEDLHWQLLAPPAPLGTVAVELTAEDGTILAEIADSDGPLAISGSARLQANGVYRLDFRLRTRGGADPRLEKLLANLGRADAEGWHHVVERGRL